MKITRRPNPNGYRPTGHEVRAAQLVAVHLDAAGFENVRMLGARVTLPLTDKTMDTLTDYANYGEDATDLTTLMQILRRILSDGGELLQIPAHVSLTINSVYADNVKVTTLMVIDVWDTRACVPFDDSAAHLPPDSDKK